MTKRNGTSFVKLKANKRNAAKVKAGDALLKPQGEEWRVVEVLKDGRRVGRQFATRTEAVEWCRSRKLRIRVPLDKRASMLGAPNSIYTTAGVRRVVSGGLPSLGKGR